MSSNVPPPASPRPVAERSAPAAPGASQPQALYTGQLSSGHTRIFADLQPGVGGTARITFSVSINSVTGATFNAWRAEIRTILGAGPEMRIAEYSGIAANPAEPEEHASKYALAAFSYVSTGQFSTYQNRSDVPFGPPSNSHYKQVLTSIRGLDFEMLRLGGTLEATVSDPNVAAYVTATYFAFADDRVTSFVGYRGSIVLVDDGEEVTTIPGILAPV